MQVYIPDYEILYNFPGKWAKMSLIEKALL